MTRQKIQCKADMKQLLEEVKDRRWSTGSAYQLKEALNRIKDWQTRKLKIGSEFQEYLAMVTRWYLEQLEGSGSEYA